MRRKIQVFGWTLIWGGVFIFGYLGWQLFVTDFINNGVQAQAAGDLDTTLGDARENPTDPVELDAADYLGPETDLPSGTPEQVDHHAEEAPDTGEPFAFIRIPIAGVDEVVFEGVDPNTLKSGPGHMESTALPGQPGNAVISGHRTTHGRPFFDLDLLEIGDQIFMESTTGTHIYEVRATQVVTPTDVWVTNPRSGGWLTLTTCNPKYSARQRLVVWAEMVSGPNHEFAQLHQLKFGAQT